MSRPPRPTYQSEPVVDDGFGPPAEDPVALAAPAADRPTMREPMREETDLQRAARRAQEILGDIGDLDEGPDEFAVDMKDIPDGWSYEWKRLTIVNAEDPAYQVSLRRKGWEPVPAARHPTYMPGSMRDGFIARKGMILMERPKVITDMVKAKSVKEARNQIENKQRQLNSAPDANHFERTPAKVKTSFEPMDIPD